MARGIVRRVAPVLVVGCDTPRRGLPAGGFVVCRRCHVPAWPRIHADVTMMLILPIRRATTWAWARKRW